MMDCQGCKDNNVLLQDILAELKKVSKFCQILVNRDHQQATGHGDGDFVDAPQDTVSIEDKARDLYVAHKRQKNTGEEDEVTDEHYLKKWKKINDKARQKWLDKAAEEIKRAVKSVKTEVKHVVHKTKPKIQMPKKKSGYQYFTSIQMTSLMEQEDVTSKNVMKKIGESWSHLTPEEKKSFSVKAEEAFKQSLIDYNKQVQNLSSEEQQQLIVDQKRAEDERLQRIEARKKARGKMRQSLSTMSPAVQGKKHKVTTMTTDVSDDEEMSEEIEKEVPKKKIIVEKTDTKVVTPKKKFRSSESSDHAEEEPSAKKQKLSPKKKKVKKEPSPSSSSSSESDKKTTKPASPVKKTIKSPVKKASNYVTQSKSESDSDSDSDSDNEAEKSILKKPKFSTSETSSSPSKTSKSSKQKDSPKKSKSAPSLKLKSSKSLPPKSPKANPFLDNDSSDSDSTEKLKPKVNTPVKKPTSKFSALNSTKAASSSSSSGDSDSE